MSGPEEYGFWANVNPDAPHPRWSQARENFLNDGSQRPTMLFNGYGDEVASLYKGLEKEPLGSGPPTWVAPATGREGRLRPAACLHSSRPVYDAVISKRRQEETV